MFVKALLGALRRQLCGGCPSPLFARRAVVAGRVPSGLHSLIRQGQLLRAAPRAALGPAAAQVACSPRGFRKNHESNWLVASIT